MQVGNVKILTVAEILDSMHITDFDSVPVFASPWQVASSGCGWRNGLQLGRQL